MKMPFGRYRGLPLESVPGPYFEWLRTRPLYWPLNEAVESEAKRREIVCSPRIAPEAMAKEIVQAGFRSLIKKYHPDVGGKHEQMVELTAAREFLEEVLR
jgi:hypothetical protein